jgi:hypothetical protein
MANDVIFNKGQGGLGRPLAGTDYVSGMLFYSASLPSGFGASDRIKTIYSIEEAVALGITNTSIGETKSTATFLVTNKGAIGDTHKLTCAVIDSVNPTASKSALGTITLANYTQVTADVVSVSTAADRLAAEINLGTPTHGFTALASTATVTITAAAGQGVFLNSGTPYVSTVVGTLAGTLTQNVVAGVASDVDVMYYHISEFFRIQPKGKLFVGIYATADATTFANVTVMQNYALGEIKQMGIYQKTTAFATSQTTTLQAILTALETNHKPISAVFYQSDFSAVTDLTTLANLKLLSNKNVTVCLGQDGDNNGFKLWKANNKSIGCMGTDLGAHALAKVNESTRWIAKFNMAATEFDALAFANGTAYTSVTDGLIANIDSFGYHFIKKEIGINGSYFNRPHTCIALTSDYTFVYNNRVIDKAIRGLRASLLPSLASPLVVNADGTLSEDLIGFFNSLCDRALEVMQRDAELSTFLVTIDPSQDVLTDNELTIAVKLVPVGVADTITVNIGFALSI